MLNHQVIQLRGCSGWKKAQRGRQRIEISGAPSMKRLCKCNLCSKQAWQTSRVHKHRRTFVLLLVTRFLVSWVPSISCVIRLPAARWIILSFPDDRHSIRKMVQTGAVMVVCSHWFPEATVPPSAKTMMSLCLFHNTLWLLILYDLYLMNWLILSTYLVHFINILYYCHYSSYFVLVIHCVMLCKRVLNMFLLSRWRPEHVETLALIIK